MMARVLEVDAPLVSAASEKPLASSRDGPGLSQVAFAPRDTGQGNSGGPHVLAAGAWDGVVRFFSVRRPPAGADGPVVEQVARHDAGSAVLSVAWVDSGRCVVGTLEGVVLVLSLSGDRSGAVVAVSARELGRHRDGQAVRCLCAGLRTHPGWVVSGSWDETVRIWDVDTRRELHCLAQQERVFAMDVSSLGMLAVGTASRRVLLWDLRGDLVNPTQRRESSLEHQTRSIAFSNDGAYFALASVAGRVAIEFVAESEQGRQYAFKCHRKVIDGVDTIFPVNSLAFHPSYGTFATGGADGAVCFWDAENKKRVSARSGYEAGVAHIAFSPQESADKQGEFMAIASSYTFEVGDKDAPPDRLAVSFVGDTARPRVKK